MLNIINNIISYKKRIVNFFIVYAYLRILEYLGYTVMFGLNIIKKQKCNKKEYA